MRLLWFVNIPFPEVRKRIGLPAVGGSGFWMVELMEGLRNRGLELHICWSGRQCAKQMTFSADGSTYHCAPERKTEEFGLRYSRLISHWTSVVSEVNPDLLEFHGTEKYHGLLAARMEIPTLVEIQGVLGALIGNYFGPIGTLEKLRFRHIYRQYLSYKIRSLRERRIFSINDAFVGRTDWDRNVLGSRNPSARYFTCPRIVREPFRRNAWRPSNSSEKPTFICTASAKPLKGCDLPIRAVGELRRRGVEAGLVFVGKFPESGYGGWLRALSRREGVADLLDFIGYAGPEHMIEAYSGALSFILPSYIENSPNALLEALCHGMPSIASKVGGITSMLEDGSTGLLFPQGDHIALANLMESFIAEPGRAAQIGAAAREASMGKHDPGSVSLRMMEVYHEVLWGRNKGHGG